MSPEINLGKWKWKRVPQLNDGLLGLHQSESEDQPTWRCNSSQPSTAGGKGRKKECREPKCVVNDTMRDGGLTPPVRAARRTRPCRGHLNVTFTTEAFYPSAQKSWSLLQKQANIKDRTHSKGNNGQEAVLEIQPDCVEWTPEPALKERYREETAPLKRVVMKPMESSERLGFQKQLQHFKRLPSAMETQSNR